MAAFEMKVLVVDTLPVDNFEPHALYLFKPQDAEFGKLYKANAAGPALILFSDAVDTKKSIVHKGITAPVAGTNTPLWYNTEDLTLYVNLPIEGVDNWVEAIAMPVMPDFAGNGEAETMARSDHYHTGTVVENPTW